PTAEMLEQVSRLKAKGFTLIDYHIHLRGGMTAEKAFDWEKKTGVISGVLENHGRAWPLSDNEKLAAFIKDARRFPVLVGIQVNDRDWYKTITPELRKQLDYILADTMIMNDKNGKAQKLWLENEYTIDNSDEWLEQYYQHCMTVVSEPITVLANPTWLPPRMEKHYAQIWTPERMERFIDAAVKNSVALEIQSPSEYPKPEFIKLALKKGAKLTVGRNNHADKPDELKRSLTLLEELAVKPENMLVLKSSNVLSPVNSKLNQIKNPSLDELRKNFAKPNRDYSTGPLWTWNDLLTEEQIRSTLRDLAAQNVKQVWVHPRPGLMTPYLSDDWFRMWKASLDEAEKLDMNVWIYDENSYPSGFAGGFVPEALPDSRGMGLKFEEVNKLDAIDENVWYVFDAALKNITETAKKDGKLPPLENNQKYLIGKVQYTPIGGWFGGKWYVDLLKKGVTEKFIEITLDAYKREIGEHFGKRVPGVFTDEPHPAGSYVGTWVSWNDEIPKLFEEKFGYSLIDNLPSLHKPVGDWKKVRHNYHALILKLFVERWARPNFEWCEANNLEWTGHYWEHGWPGTSHGPDNMAMYIWHQRPSIDLLMNTYNDNSANAQFGNVRSGKELASIANQMGYSRTLSENYGAGGWDLRFEDMKRLGDWSYALGVNTTNEHLSYVTIRGARKRDHPQSFSYHASWFENYQVLADYFTRLSYMLSQGRQVNRIVVLEPTTTAWMYQGTPELGSIGKSFTDLVNALEQNQVEYDLASEDTIARFGKVDSRTFSINLGKYDLVILPPYMENLNRRTLELLSQYAMNGGKLLCAGEFPTRCDGASPGDAEARLLRLLITLPSSEKVTQETAVTIAKKRTADTGLSITVPEGTRSIFHHRRTLPDCEIVFICNADQEKTVNVFVEFPKGKYPTALGLDTGKEGYIQKAYSMKFNMLPSSSCLFLLSDKIISDANTFVGGVEISVVKGSETTIKRLDSNVLTLDYVDMKVGNEEKKDVYTYQADKWIWQKNGFGKNPFDNEVQFKDGLITKTFPADSGFSATYRFTLEGFGDTVASSFAFVIERPDLYKVSCNGKPLATPENTGGQTPEFKEWYLDKSFGKFDISEAVKNGDNEITLTANPLTVWTALEPAYLLGDFSLRSADKGFVVIPPVPLQLRTPEPKEKVIAHNQELERVSWLTKGIGFSGSDVNSGDAAPFLMFDLGKKYDLAEIKVWNYNEVNLTKRGVKELFIAAALPAEDKRLPVKPSMSGNVADTPYFVAVSLTEGSSKGPQTISLADKDFTAVQMVAFTVKSNHNGVRYPVAASDLEKMKSQDNGFVGLAEVRFIAKDGSTIDGVKIHKKSSELVTGSHDRRAAYILDGSGLESPEQQQGWHEQGLPFYAGKVAYSRSFDIDKVEGKYTVKLPNSPVEWYGATAKIIVNGNDASSVVSALWQVDVTKFIKAGKNEVSVVIYGTPKNLLGPHHAGKLRGSAWPSAFHRAPEHQPAGSSYDVIGYGLFGPFELECLR
ncbi:MAG: hypothetical protein FWE67_11340, partial [Planctomycetaceae bacterium]|nr:hypothetical protein [Planctomycetaceae bacterium]